ncbi:putative RNA-binding protein 15B [Cavia porcellus]|uniref:putative RNA-binding protein 15B n=1 Tax=Cavia porcellus TaxID=10141 RepID=UPI000661C971|nr:putative RNA-binding protein 15B [Cavia porcellus]
MGHWAPEHVEDRLFALRAARLASVARTRLGCASYVALCRAASSPERPAAAAERDPGLKGEPEGLRGGSGGNGGSSSSNDSPSSPSSPQQQRPLRAARAARPRRPAGLPAPARASPASASAQQEPGARFAAAFVSAAAPDHDRGRPYDLAAGCEGDPRATRNLHIGNLDHVVSQGALRGASGKRGISEEVAGKRPARGQGAARAFLRFRNLDMARRAKGAMSCRAIGRSPIKLGPGKASPTTRLWVGGLGPNTSLATLAREFDRFGIIRTIDHVKGDTFAYIQYESLDAAQVACAQMRGFPLGGPHRRLRVDFAKTEETRYPQQYRPSLLPVDYELLTDGYHRHPTVDAHLRVRDKSHPYLYLDRHRTFLERDWIGPRKSADHRNSLEGYSRSVHSHSGEHWRGEGDRGLSRIWEDRWEDNRGRTPHCAYKERSWTNGVGQQYGYEGNHAGAGTKESVSNALSSSTPRAQEWGHHLHLEAPDSFHGEKTRERECNYWTSMAEPKSLEESKPETKKLTTLSEHVQTLQLGWNGFLVLKNSCFPTSMHILEGDQGVISGLLRDQTSESRLAQLKIAQRLPLDHPKFKDVTQRIKQGSARGFAVLLATQSVPSGPGTEGMPTVEPDLKKRLLRNLISYLKGKQAAGVIRLPVGGSKGRGLKGMLYAFPPCPFSQQYLQSALRTQDQLEEEHMLIVMIVAGSA